MTSAAPQPHPLKLSAVALRSSAVAALGGLLFGFDTAVISGAEKALQGNFSLDSSWLGFTVATALIGTIVGSVVIEKPADSIGRKGTLYILAVLYLVSSLGCAIAPSWWILVVSRFVGGLAIGGASVVAPMYIAEIAPSHLRGRLVAINQLNVVIGILLSFISNYVISLYFPADQAWRWMLGVVAIPSAAFFVLIQGIVESPRWLVKVGRTSDASAVLAKLGHDDVARELGEIEASLAGTQAEDRLFRRRYAWSIFLAWSIAMFNQLSGINALMYYAPRIFEMTGVGSGAALLQSIAVGGTNLIFTLVGMALIDFVGRRKLIIWGSFGYIASLGMVTWAFQHYGGNFDRSGGLLVLVGLLVFQASHAFSQGAVIWVFIAEVFPNAVRAKGQAFGSFTHWFMAAAVSWSFPIVAARSGAWAFGFFTAMMVLQLLFAWKLMPETKGGTLEDIEARLAS